MPVFNHMINTVYRPSKMFLANMESREIIKHDLSSRRHCRVTSF